ncbi:ClpP/crotonase-like domain-containing protein [Geopyxis carbonaria]|nr:ClpP/crotonase-like domain-containing protein [Geopyxis carbonaria]
MSSVQDYESFLYFKVHWPAQGVAHVEIKRPEKLNAFKPIMFAEIGEVFLRLSNDSSVRAIILSGSGEKAFTAGLDIKGELSFLNNDDDMDPARKGWKIRHEIKKYQDSVGAIEKCEKPVVCVLHGISFGLAIDIATCADIRLCSLDTKFSVKEVDIGIAADLGTLSRLPRVVGSQSWVKDITLTARLFGPQEALQHGFVSKLLPTKDDAIQEALKLATLISEKSPVAVQSTKTLINYSLDHTIQEGLDYTQAWNAFAIQASDPTLAIKGTIERKTPIFPKL